MRFSGFYRHLAWLVLVGKSSPPAQQDLSNPIHKHSSLGATKYGIGERERGEREAMHIKLLTAIATVIVSAFALVQQQLVIVCAFSPPLTTSKTYYHHHSSVSSASSSSTSLQMGKLKLLYHHKYMCILGMIRQSLSY